MSIFKSIAFSAAAVVALSNVAAAETTLRFSDVLPDGNFQVENAKTFAEAVKEATGGDVTVQINAGGSLGFKGPDQLGAVRDGLVDMADINISQQVGLNPLFGAEGVPFLVSSMDELKEYHAFLRPEFEKLAEQYKNVLLPGYTHLQVAMPSSFGMWFSAYAETLIDDIYFLKAAYKVADQNPLGSAAGYGSSFPIDRDETTKLLEFDTLKYNSVAAQMGRGKVEKATAFGMSSIAATLSKMAMDIGKLPAGIYFIQIMDETGAVLVTEKVVRIKIILNQFCPRPSLSQYILF